MSKDMLYYTLVNSENLHQKIVIQNIQIIQLLIIFKKRFNDIKVLATRLGNKLTNV